MTIISMGLINKVADLVFWDTSAFVALSNRQDNWHQQAVIVSQNLAQKEALILTTDAVLTEVANSFSKPQLRPMAQQIIEAVQQSVLLEIATIVHIDESLWERGWQLFLNRPDKAWGLTDCLSFIVMQDYRIKLAFTADHHFEQAGFVRLLK